MFSKIHQNFKGKEKLTEVKKAGRKGDKPQKELDYWHMKWVLENIVRNSSMHEAMERGNAKDQLIVVPNESILKQWVKPFLKPFEC